MAKQTAVSKAYMKLQGILGSKLIRRSRTLRVEGQPVQTFSQELLLLPTGTPLDDKLSAAEHYVDKKTKEEFFAFVISETEPRDKVPRPSLNDPYVPLNDSSVHSAIPLIPTKSSPSVLGISRTMQADLEKEFNGKWTNSDKGRQ